MTVVDVIKLVGGDGRTVQRIRVKRHGFFVGQVRTPDQLTGLGVNLADFTEV